MGRLAKEYHRSIEERGYKLRYCETRLQKPPREIAGVIVVPKTVSHPLLGAARSVAKWAGAPIAYARGSSPKAIMEALEQLLSAGSKGREGPDL
jgi:hypothetical protein